MRVGTCRFVQAAMDSSPEGISLPDAWLPSSTTERASKLRKMRAQAQACTCSGTERAAQVRWSVHIDPRQVLPERETSECREPGTFIVLPSVDTWTRHLQEAGDPKLQAWRVPVEFSFRLIRRSL